NSHVRSTATLFWFLIPDPQAPLTGAATGDTMLDLNTFLERKSGVLAQRQSEMEADPARATVRLSAQSWVAGFTGARPVRLRDHSLLTDSAPGLGGNAIGPSAPELLLGALASCLVHTYLIVAALESIALENVTVTVQGALDFRAVVGLPADEPPRMEQVTWQAAVDTPAPADVVAHLHAEVERLCPVLNTLRYPVAVLRTATVPD
ncbi:MAG: OsmC family protein, partial [Caldilineaceae bacterium]